VIEAAGKAKSIEIFVNFMIMDINRNALRRNPDKVVKSKAEQMTVTDALCAQVDPAAYPDLTAMFGFEQTPALLIMREQIVLYAEACEPSRDTLETLLERVQALDMKLVRDNIEAQRAAEALEIRSVCLAARRRTAHN